MEKALNPQTRLRVEGVWMPRAQVVRQRDEDGEFEMHVDPWAGAAHRKQGRQPASKVSYTYID